MNTNDWLSVLSIVISSATLGWTAFWSVHTKNRPKIKFTIQPSRALNNNVVFEINIDFLVLNSGTEAEMFVKRRIVYEGGKDNWWWFDPPIVLPEKQHLNINFLSQKQKGNFIESVEYLNPEGKTWKLTKTQIKIINENINSIGLKLDNP